MSSSDGPCLPVSEGHVSDTETETGRQTYRQTDRTVEHTQCPHNDMEGIAHINALF